MIKICYRRVRKSSEIKKIRGFPGMFYRFFSRAFPRFLKPRMKITFTTYCSKKDLIVNNIITVKQQCAPSVSFQY